MITPDDVIAALPPVAGGVRLPTLRPNGGSRPSLRPYNNLEGPNAKGTVGPEGPPRGWCGAGGSEKLRAYMREKAKALGIENIRVNASGCLDRCELGPNMVIYPEGVWYHYDNTEDVD